MRETSLITGAIGLAFADEIFTHKLNGRMTIVDIMQSRVDIR